MSEAPAPAVLPPGAHRSAIQSLLAVALLEARLLAAPRRLVVLVLLAAVPPGLALLLDAVGQVRGFPGGRETWTALFLLSVHVRTIVPMASLYLGSSLVADEVEGGTLPYLITRPVPRAGILAAKFVSAWVAVSAFGLASAVVTVAVLGILGGSSVSPLWPLVLVVPAASGAYLALFGLVGLLTPRALVIGVLYGALFEAVLAQAPLLARRLAVGHWTTSILLPFPPYRGIGEMLPLLQEMVASPAAAWPTLLGITVGALACGGLLLHRRQHAPFRET